MGDVESKSSMGQISILRSRPIKQSKDDAQFVLMKSFGLSSPNALIQILSHGDSIEGSRVGIDDLTFFDLIRLRRVNVCQALQTTFGYAVIATFYVGRNMAFFAKKSSDWLT